MPLKEFGFHGAVKQLEFWSFFAKILLLAPSTARAALFRHYTKMENHASLQLKIHWSFCEREEKYADGEEKKERLSSEFTSKYIRANVPFLLVLIIPVLPSILICHGFCDLVHPSLKPHWPVAFKRFAWEGGELRWEKWELTLEIKYM